MKKVDIKKIKSMTGDYDAWLMSYLKNKKTACVYLQSALDDYQIDYDREVFMLTLKDVARAQGGIGNLAELTKLNREHLYHLLSGKGNPRLDTLSAILHAFSMRINWRLLNEGEKWMGRLMTSLLAVSLKKQSRTCSIFASQPTVYAL